ncbi:uncharacterized protein LOC113566399 [Drosophila persimilis]|uniref:uncharacterized protein LOC113566399 n=1 Tax=Drosophila persimilis TaxID=7234 RepID=UPI000F08366E|nr:uncharacterized protein LOC113566399 [Drosophila persimilis]
MPGKQVSFDEKNLQGESPSGPAGRPRPGPGPRRAGRPAAEVPAQPQNGRDGPVLKRRL